MAHLLFEIWRDEDGQSTTQVCQQNDHFRTMSMPSATLVHAFTAISDFDAVQINYDWNGWGVWQPEPDWIEQPFTDDEQAAQQAYLDQRNGS